MSLSYLAYALNNLGWAALLGGPPERARALYAESMRMCLELGDTLAAPETLLGLAYAAEARGEAERAAGLFGACEALREVMGAPPEPGESALQEPYLSAAHSQLREDEWQEVWAEGGVMSFEEAVSYALDEEEAGG